MLLQRVGQSCRQNPDANIGYWSDAHVYECYFFVVLEQFFEIGGVGTLPKTNMDTQNDGLEKVTPFKNGKFWYLC